MTQEEKNKELGKIKLIELIFIILFIVFIFIGFYFISKSFINDWKELEERQKIYQSLTTEEEKCIYLYSESRTNHVPVKCLKYFK